METQQLLVYIAAAAIVALYLLNKWKKSRMPHYSPKQVAELLHSPDVVLLDVRTQQERQQKTIKGSLHIPLDQLSRKLDTLTKYKEKEIICFCQSGSRSSAATSLLVKNGFQAANMVGGMSAWSLAQVS
ncbi:MAG TPA: rhodanese-like domain-containing protein [Bacteroidota bacterium]|nr:rhodanese-like domain-containing protein [Bacteroidota bacterium]